jgi:hypothetical protein
VKLLDEIKFRSFLAEKSAGTDLADYLFSLAFTWDESEHPREPAGGTGGGQFAPAGSGSGQATGKFTQHSSLMKAFGFSKTGETKGPNPENPSKTSTLTSTWEHPKYGTVTVDHMAHTFEHQPVGASDKISKETGKGSIALEQHLLDHQPGESSPKSTEPDKASPATPQPSKEDSSFTDTEKIFGKKPEFPPEHVMAKLGDALANQDGFNGKVKLSSLTPTQDVVGNDKIASLIKDWDPKKAGKLDVVQVNGKNYLYDGHHTAAAALQKGETELPARFYSPDDDDEDEDKTPSPASPTRNHSDSALAKKIQDDRLTGSFYQQKPDFTGMSVADRLRYIEMNLPKKGDLGSLPKSQQMQSDVPHEFALVDYDHSIRSKIPKGLTPDGIRDYLKANKLTDSLDNKAYTFRPKVDFGHNPYDHALNGLDAKGRQEFIQHLPEHLAQLDAQNKYPQTFWDNNKLSQPEAEQLSDAVEAKAKEVGYANHTEHDYNHSLTATRDSLYPYSKNYETARKGLFSGWAMSGGGVKAQKYIRDAAARAFPQNQGIQFYNQDSKFDAPGTPKLQAPDRLVENVKKLKAETEAFYKAKLAKKSDSDPDLSSKSIELYRGVGGHVSAYTPAAAESWSKDKSTATRFGKLMAPNAIEDHTILTTKSNYGNALWTWESAAGKPGWPAESELKGKKEFVLLGGTIKDVNAETKSKDLKWNGKKWI